MTDLRQETLFGKKTISSISYNEQTIIRDILALHFEGKEIDCDPTYSIGNFYKDGIHQPKYKFDKIPYIPGVIEATSDKLPLVDNSVNVIMFDPPFVMGGDTYNEAVEGSCIIAKRFTGFKNFDELKKMYSSSLKEFYRILIDGGGVYSKIKIVFRVR